MPRYLFQGQGDSQGQLGPTLQKLADRAEFSNTKQKALESLFEAVAPMAAYSPEAEGAIMFHASPNWWKDLRFKDEFLKTGEGQTVKGTGHYTTGSPQHAWERYNLDLGGDQTTQGYAAGRIHAANLPQARKDFVSAMKNVGELERRLALIKSANPSTDINVLRSAAEDVFSRDLIRAENRMKSAATERDYIPQRPNAPQGNILTVNTKRPFSEYVNYLGNVSADPVNRDALWKIVRDNPKASAVFDSNVNNYWADMIKGLEHRFGEENTGKILNSAGIAGNIHPNMTNKTSFDIEDLTAGDIGKYVADRKVSPTGYNAVTINPNDLDVLNRTKSLESLFSNLPENWQKTWR